MKRSKLTAKELKEIQDRCEESFDGTHPDYPWMGMQKSDYKSITNHIAALEAELAGLKAKDAEQWVPVSSLEIGQLVLWDTDEPMEYLGPHSTGGYLIKAQRETGMPICINGSTPVHPIKDPTPKENEFGIMVEVPETNEDGGCDSSCQFMFTNTFACRLEFSLPLTIPKFTYPLCRCKPGPGCPRYDKTKETE